MKYIIATEIIIFLVMMLNARHCDVGCLGYPDEWDCRKHEKIHDILSIVCIIFWFLINPLIILFD